MSRGITQECQPTTGSGKAAGRIAVHTGVVRIPAVLPTGERMSYPPFTGQ